MAESHAHCEQGLFHDAPQLHTHPHCKNCFRMRRCEGKDVKLLRCAGCSIATYCSKDCQKANWRAGHKLACQLYKTQRDRAIELSGSAKAWSDLAQWVEYHHASLINSTLACYLNKKDAIPDVTAKYLLHISLNYRNDPELPPQKQFEMRGAHFSHKDDPGCAMLYNVVFAQRPAAVEMGKMEMGNRYWGTGAYLLMVRFRPNKAEFGVDGVPFWKHFGIDKDSANAHPACRNPLEQLEENLHSGKKMRFCCGKVEGLPTCCCGGWTHEISGHEPKVGW
ncbi:hypothetical protein OH76DRAFT_198188 [Lentinus brumalis]|uniref:MYND-type domain-containing protein n=1 Tax=Lentinus brumalis TaxID=2498619 RepID=A0A371DI60_9APHY|nr:hypothetical protein OH76DRAFT_198188 [Polyporus brumalis]